jgi:hypothetical protein
MMPLVITVVVESSGLLVGVVLMENVSKTGIVINIKAGREALCRRAMNLFELIAGNRSLQLGVANCVDFKSARGHGETKLNSRYFGDLTD